MPHKSRGDNRMMPRCYAIQQPGIRAPQLRQVFMACARVTGEICHRNRPSRLPPKQFDNLETPAKYSPCLSARRTPALEPDLAIVHRFRLTAFRCHKIAPVCRVHRPGAIALLPFRVVSCFGRGAFSMPYRGRVPTLTSDVVVVVSVCSLRYASSPSATIKQYLWNRHNLFVAATSLSTGPDQLATLLDAPAPA